MIQETNFISMVKVESTSANLSSSKMEKKDCDDAPGIHVFLANFCEFWGYYQSHEQAKMKDLASSAHFHEWDLD